MVPGWDILAWHGWLQKELLEEAAAVGKREAEKAERRGRRNINAIQARHSPASSMLSVMQSAISSSNQILANS